MGRRHQRSVATEQAPVFGVVGARSASHLRYVSAYIRTAAPFERSRIVVLDPDRAPENDEWPPYLAGRVTADRSPHDRFDRVVCVGAVPFGLMPGLIGRQPSIVRRLTIVDEGFGSYGSLRSRFSALRREGASTALAAVKACTRSLASRLGRRHAAFRCDGGVWRIDPAVADEFRGSSDARSAWPPVAVYLGQPWVEQGLIEPAAFATSLNALADELKSCGWGFATIAHPSTRRSSERTTAESDPVLRSASLVVGDTSTALLLAPAALGIPSARLALEFSDGREPRMSRRQARLLEFFAGPPSGPGVLAALARSMSDRQQPRSPR